MKKLDMAVARIIEEMRDEANEMRDGSNRGPKEALCCEIIADALDQYADALAYAVIVGGD